mgnify:CR=1 FL=1
MLSNTATPIYYGDFRDKVLRGEIPVCREISMEMNRIDSLIADPRYYYDDQAIDGFVRYCETECTLSDGEPLKLLDSFKLWAEQLLAWYYFEDVSTYIPNEKGIGGHYETRTVKHRLVDKQYLIVARGAAKSMYASLLQNYMLNVDTSTTHQIVTAPTMAQAEEIMAPIKTAIARAPGPLFKFMTQGVVQNTRGNNYTKKMLAATKKGVQNFLTNSLVEVRPMSVDKLQGLRPKLCTIDEWLSGDVREDVVEALQQGAQKIEGWMIVAISSEGTVRNGVGDTKKMELMRILRGEDFDPHTSIWHYRLDDIEEVGKPSTWMKANPNIGQTVSYDSYHRAVQRAETNPALRNDILAKMFGIPMEGYTYFFTYEETLVHKKRDFWKMPCAMGADLSHGDDFCAFTFLFPLPNGSYGVKTRCYISSLTLQNLPAAARVKYEEFIQEGSLIVLECTVLDMMDVYSDLDRFIDKSEYDVYAFGFDPYNAKDFVQRWEALHGSFGVEKVIQGARTESVPLGELKILAGERMLLFDQNLMQWTMGNCIALEDTNGNRKLLKARREDKIDAVSALMDAYVAYKTHRDVFE